MFLKFLLAALLSQASAAPATTGGGGTNVVSGGYTGAGDIASFTAWWSNSRAYSSAKRGAAIINACNSAGGGDVCADMVTDSTTGILTPATINTGACPGSQCTVKTYYDQVGSN